MSEDPIERMVAAALQASRIAFTRPGDGPDFHLDGFYIECKQFYSERAVRQLKDREDIILVQGRKAAAGFAALLRTTATAAVQAETARCVGIARGYGKRYLAAKKLPPNDAEEIFDAAILGALEYIADAIETREGD